MAIVLVAYGWPTGLFYTRCHSTDSQRELDGASRRAARGRRRAAQSFLGVKGPQTHLAGLSFVRYRRPQRLDPHQRAHSLCDARDGVFFRRFATWHARSAVPVTLDCRQAVWATCWRYPHLRSVDHCVSLPDGMVLRVTTSEPCSVLRGRLPDVPAAHRTVATHRSAGAFQPGRSGLVWGMR